MDNQGMRKLLPILILFILLPFQACQDKLNFITDLGSDLKSGVNGEGYGGKPTPYNFEDPKLSCSEIGANGKPLPRAQIFLFSSGLAQLVRENCADITPVPLSSQDFSMGSQDEIIYKNQSFLANRSLDAFEVVAASCPAGQTMRAAPVRLSDLQAPLDLQDPIWEHGGLSVTLEGSLASLPLYNVRRSDPSALESWHRMAQSPLLRASESYVFSFYVKPSATEKAMFTSYYPNVQDFRIEFELLTGTANVQSLTGVNLISTKAQAFAGGLYVSIYFQPLSDVQANIGVASSGQFLGSNLSMTALQLETVSNFCSP